MKKIFLLILLFNFVFNSYLNAQFSNWEFNIGGNLLLLNSSNNFTKNTFITNVNINAVYKKKLQFGIGKEQNFAYNSILKSNLYGKLRFYFLELDSCKSKLFIEHNYYTLFNDPYNEIEKNNTKMFDFGIGNAFKINKKAHLELSILYRYIYVLKKDLSNSLNESIESNGIIFRIGLSYYLFSKNEK